MAQVLASRANDPGPTCLAVSKDGALAYTGGVDCIVRVWKLGEGAEQEPAIATEADGPVTTIDTSATSWISGSEDSVARRYDKKSTQMSGEVTGAGGVSILCVAVDPEGKQVAVTSEELDIRVVDLQDIMKSKRLKGHTGIVRKATWHPSSSLLTTSGADGNILVWDMSQEKPPVEATIEGVIPATADTDSQEFQYDCSAVWHPSGQHFYTAARTHEIAVVSRSDWIKSATISDKTVSGAITALAISVNGLYLASASNSKVHIWSTLTTRLVKSHDAPAGSVITQLAFSPRDNLLLWTDMNGTFSRWSDPIPPTLPSPTKRTNAPNTSTTTTTVAPGLFDEELGESNGPKDQEDADMDMDNADAEADPFGDDWIIDDLGTGFKEPTAAEKPARAGKSSDGYVKEMVSITKAQPPFQPGSTPMENRKRYLAYNMLGAIEVTDQDTHNVVNVVFFDQSARKGFHFTDHFKYDLGYLGERGAVFACKPEGDNPAQVIYKAYGTWTSANEWTYVLKRAGTSVLGVAASGIPPSRSLRESNDSDLQGYGNVIVATSEGDLTFLSGTGRERRIVGLGGDFVSMVAAPEWVFVVHRPGSTTIDGSQNLFYTLINLDDFSVRQRDVLPIQKGHTLKWIGLTDQGVPAMYDSAGYLHLLSKYRIPHHGIWTRLLDTNLLERRKGKDESYWPVGVHENNFMCVILKGRQEHPGFPRPLMQELPLRMPFRREEEKDEQIERELFMVQNALDALDEELTTEDIVQRERAMDKEFIILIQGACKSDNAARAIELAKLLHNLVSFDSAIKIAEFYNLPGLREKLGRLKADKEENEDRLVAARNKRRRWMKTDAPLREVQSAANGFSAGRADLLSDERPPPPVERPRMARVTVPIIEKTRYTSQAPMPSSETQETYVDSADSPSSGGENKRKRPDEDVPTGGSEFAMPPPPPKQRANPFAKKPGHEGQRNPFARKNDTTNGKTIHKSESFFDKVGAAEDSAKKRPGKPAQKEKLAKQATLSFAPKPVQRKSPDQEDTQTESQADVPMSDATTFQDESQQSLEDSAMDLEETQFDDSQSQEVETQPIE